MKKLLTLPLFLVSLQAQNGSSPAPIFGAFNDAPQVPHKLQFVFGDQSGSGPGVLRYAIIWIVENSTGNPANYGTEVNSPTRCQFVVYFTHPGRAYGYAFDPATQTSYWSGYFDQEPSAVRPSGKCTYDFSKWEIQYGKCTTFLSGGQQRMKDCVWNGTSNPNSPNNALQLEAYFPTINNTVISGWTIGSNAQNYSWLSPFPAP